MYICMYIYISRFVCVYICFDRAKQLFQTSPTGGEDISNVLNRALRILEISGAPC